MDRIAGRMGFEGGVWRLMRQEQLLGEIVIDEADFPWLDGHFVPAPTFGEVKPWFDESLALLEAEEYERFCRSRCDPTARARRGHGAMYTA